MGRQYLTDSGRMFAHLDCPAGPVLTSTDAFPADVAPRATWGAGEVAVAKKQQERTLGREIPGLGYQQKMWDRRF
jgi:hypothetical protein